MKFEKFNLLKNFNYTSGWDNFALDYAQLGDNNRVYSLTKELMYDIINENICLNKNSHVLDIGCGTGNDFPFFLAKNARITAFDKSDGMLNKAQEKYAEQINAGKINLLKGQLEKFDLDSIEENRYDLIFSVTGGLAYINNTELERIFNLFKKLLKPGGKVITAHFNKFCLIENVFNILKFKLKRLNQRNSKQLIVNIKNENMTMYLRSPQDLIRLAGEFKYVKRYPLLVITPPYQTGYNPGSMITGIHRILERPLINRKTLTKIADQVVMVFSND